MLLRVFQIRDNAGEVDVTALHAFCMGHRRMTVVPAGHDVQLAILCRSIGVVLEIIRVTGGGRSAISV